MNVLATPALAGDNGLSTAPAEVALQRSDFKFVYHTNPERFFAMLRAHGIAVVPHAFGDHHAYTAADFEFGSKLPVLMTEKDAVKVRAIPGAIDPSFHSVPVRAELPEAFWIALLDRIPPRTPAA